MKKTVRISKSIESTPKDFADYEKSCAVLARIQSGYSVETDEYKVLKECKFCLYFSKVKNRVRFEKFMAWIESDLTADEKTELEKLIAASREEGGRSDIC